MVSSLDLWAFSSFSKCLKMKEHGGHFSTFPVFTVPGPAKSMQMYEEYVKYISETN